jgi:comEA protein
MFLYFGRIRCRARSFDSICAIASITAFLAVLIVAASSACAAKQPPAHPIDLNTATAAQLEQLPGIGPARASAIIAFREKSGPFHRVEDLLAVRGISKDRLEKIRPYVKITPPKPKSHNPN